MLHKLLNAIDQHKPFAKAQAHCDIPCGIYDPMPAQIAAMTVVRMVDQIQDLENHTDQDHGGNRDMHYQNKMSRFIAEKENAASQVKKEVHIIWGDFFKAPQFAEHPELHELTHGIMLAASKSKQNVDREAAVDLLDKVNSFAEIFYKIKNIPTKRAKYHCKPNLDMVYPEL